MISRRCVYRKGCFRRGGWALWWIGILSLFVLLVVSLFPLLKTSKTQDVRIERGLSMVLLLGPDD
jgi:hypothetical protein